MYHRPVVRLLNITPLGVGEVASRSCYDSFDKSEHPQIRGFMEKTNCDLNIDSSDLLYKLSHAYHHESVLEHVNCNFLIVGVARGVLMQLERHRIASYSVRSTRYTMGDLLKVAVWSYVRGNGAFKPWVRANGIFANKDEDILDLLIDQLWDKFLILFTGKRRLDLILSITPKETPEAYNVDNVETILKLKTRKNVGDDWKWIVDDNWSTTLVWTINLRSLKNFIKLRKSGSAWLPIRELAEAIVAVLPKSHLNMIVKER